MTDPGVVEHRGGWSVPGVAGDQHSSSALALEVYARKMERQRDTCERMDALIRGADWAQMGTNGEITTLESATAVDAEKEKTLY